MTNFEDALTAVDAGADAVGFVFYEKSPRNIRWRRRGRLWRSCRRVWRRLGVFVDWGDLDPMRVLLEAGLSGTQSYLSPESNGRNRAGSALEVSLLPKRARFLRALPMKLFGDEEEIQKINFDFSNCGRNRPKDFPIPEGLMDTFVLDSGDLRQPGGTGKTFDWKKAEPIAEEMRRGESIWLLRVD
jgi:phosphoribosylanthranilate isomerase